MPGRLPADVRAKAREVGKRLGHDPWWDARDAVLAAVYREMGRPAPAPRRRKRRAESAPEARPPAPRPCDECPVCLEPRRLGTLAPCGHRVCAECQPRCRGRCPHCRAPVRAFAPRTY